MIWMYPTKSASREWRDEVGVPASLAEAIGASSAIFSVIENVLLDPFPYVDTNRVVSIVVHDVKNSRPGGRSWMKLPEYLEYQRQNHVFQQVTGGG